MPGAGECRHTSSKCDEARPGRRSRGNPRSVPLHGGRCPAGIGARRRGARGHELRGRVRAVARADGNARPARCGRGRGGGTGCRRPGAGHEPRLDPRCTRDRTLPRRRTLRARQRRDRHRLGASPAGRRRRAGAWGGGFRGPCGGCRGEIRHGWSGRPRGRGPGRTGNGRTGQPCGGGRARVWCRRPGRPCGRQDAWSRCGRYGRPRGDGGHRSRHRARRLRARAGRRGRLRRRRRGRRASDACGAESP